MSVKWRQLIGWRHTQVVEGTMLKTRLCELLGLDVPIILAPMGTCTSAELAAAVGGSSPDLSRAAEQFDLSSKTMAPIPGHTRR
jgi:hypothetical protein